MVDPNGAIGVFDSGVGGLTVLRQIAQRLPNESLLYFGDTARVPYGTKSPQTVLRYARACINILMERGVKMVVVACNTASAFAVETLRAELSVPLIDVVEPGAHAAVEKTAQGRIGVIGTAGTVASGAYPKAIARLAPKASVLCKSCPLFVPLAEEGWTDGPVPRAAAETYLDELLRAHIDTLVLGCTHYPLLKKVIAQVTGPGVTLVDSAEETARAVEATLHDLQGRRGAPSAPEHHFLVSDAPEGFTRIAERFFGCPIGPVEWVDF